jgi:hypothetical protein
MRSLAAVALGALCALAAFAHGAPAATEEPRWALCAPFQRLSFDLRGRRLSVEECRTIGTELGERPRAQVWQSYVDRWLDRATLKQLLGEMLRQAPAASHFIGSLAVWQPTPRDEAIYYLPATAPAAGAPCSMAETVPVSPWWAVGDPVRVCRATHAPDHVFDEVGYCAGNPEPRVSWPPRPGCGCGPLLMSCLPPAARDPGFVARLDREVRDEVVETATRLVEAGRPYDELLTTTATWQTGLVEFLYLRRELLKILRARPYSPALEDELRARVRAIDLSRPGRWVERKGPYRGSGLLFNTPAVNNYAGTYRGLMKVVLEEVLCTKFQSVHVDSASLLKTIGAEAANLRLFGGFGPSVADTPMRRQPGCQGCHAPLDAAAGMLREIATPLYGSVETGLPSDGELYISGAEDLRGRAKGYAGLAGLVVRQPEFVACTVDRAFRQLHRRAPLTADRPRLSAISTEFERGGRRWRELVRALLLDPSYAGP